LNNTSHLKRHNRAECLCLEPRHGHSGGSGRRVGWRRLVSAPRWRGRLTWWWVRFVSVVISFSYLQPNTCFQYCQELFWNVVLDFNRRAAGLFRDFVPQVTQ
jgi:hypothetical protein